MSDPKLRPGTKYCKCPACGEYFTSDSNFLMHRAGAPEKRYCVHPSKVLGKDRKPRLRLTDTGYWASARRRIDLDGKKTQE